METYAESLARRYATSPTVRAFIARESEHVTLSGEYAWSGAGEDTHSETIAGWETRTYFCGETECAGTHAAPGGRCEVQS